MISLNSNGSVEFLGNTATDPATSLTFGGAISVWSYSTITLNNNGSVSFSENTAGHGGAIAAESSNDVSISLKHNGSVEFLRNTATSNGGAIYVYSGSITLSNNGRVQFIDNTASGTFGVSYGGAIRGGTITLCENGRVEFIGNSAFSRASSSFSARGGAIYVVYGGLRICNNDTVLFEKNAEIIEGVYRLRSINASSESISLSAPEGAIIEFRDSVYLSSGRTVNFNADYTDAQGGKHKQTGDIIFTGAYVEDDLFIVKGNVEGTEEEILNSRTSTVYAMTNLYGGCLRVEDGAIYKGTGITAVAGSNATVRVKDASLEHSGYELAFSSGSTLELSGVSTISGDVEMESGSSIRLSDGSEITWTSGSSLHVSGDLTANASIQGQGAFVIDGQLTLLSMVADSLQTKALILTSSSASNSIGSALMLSGIVDSAGDLSIDGTLTASCLKTKSLSASALILTSGSASNSIGSAVTLSGAVDVAGALSVSGSLRAASLKIKSLNAEALTLSSSSAVNSIGSSVTLSGAVDVAGSLGVSGHLAAPTVRAAKGLTAASLQTDSLTADSLKLTDASASSLIGSALALNGTVDVAGNLSIDGSLSAASLKTKSLSATSMTLTSSSASNIISSSVMLSGAVDVEGSLSVSGHLSAPTVRVVQGLTAASLRTDSLLSSSLTLTDAMASSHIGSSIALSGAVESFGDLSINGSLSAASLDTKCLSANSLILTSSSASNRIDSALSLSGAADIAGNLTISGSLTAASLKTKSLNATSLTLTSSSAGNSIGSSVTMNGAVDVAGSLSVSGHLAAPTVCADKGLTAASLWTDSLTADYLKLTDATASSHIGSSLALRGAVDVAGSLSVSGHLSAPTVRADEGLTAASLRTDSLTSCSLTLSTATACNWIGSSVVLSGAMDVAGDLSVEGSLQATSVQAKNLDAVTLTLTASEVSSFIDGTLQLTGVNCSHSVSGNLSTGILSLHSGASMTVSGTLTASEILMSGTAKTLTAGAFGAESMNFVLDRAALESLGIMHGKTACIARATQNLPIGFTVTLNGGKSYVDAAAYEYAILANENEVRLMADYAYEGMQVWYRGAWVGDAAWNTDYFIAGFDAIDGKETVNLKGDDISGYYLIVALDDGVDSTTINNATLNFGNVDLGGGELILNANTTLTAQEVYGPGEKMSIHETSALEAAKLQLGTLDMTYGSTTLKDASLGAITGTTGKLTILQGGKVTVNSDVELGSFLNEGTLNLGSHNLTVNALTNQGGNVTAGEVSVQCRAGLMAEFDTLIADRVTVENSISGTRYTDDIVLGDGSIVGELLADKLVVKGGTVTLGSTTAETVQDVHSLELQNGATLILNQTYVNLGQDFVAEDGSVIQLVEGGGLRMGNLGVSSLEGAVKLDAAGLTEEVPHQLNGACLTAYGSDDISYDGALLNSGIVNESSATFSVTHAGNTLKEVHAQNGDIVLYNRAQHELQTLKVAAGRTLSAYSRGYADNSKEAAISVSGTASFGTNSQFNADLTMLNGSTLDLQDSLSMGSSLTLGSGVTLSGNLLTQLQNAGEADVVTLFEGVDTLTILNKVYSSISHEDEFLASSVFSNLCSTDGRAYYFVYSTAADGEGALGIYTTLKPELTLPWESGTYNVDGDVKIAATGGTINLRADAVLSGSIANTAVTTTRGNYTARVEADITGKSSLTVNGGTLELVGHNTYTGGTTVNGGELYLASANALGTGSVNLAGGTLLIGADGVSNTMSSSGKSTIRVEDGIVQHLKSTIANSGELTLEGEFDISDLNASSVAGGYVDVNGALSSNGGGFSQAAGSKVTLATGTVNSQSATAIYNGEQVRLSGGNAYFGGGIDYSTYRLLSGSSAAISQISAMAGDRLKLISMSGGTLTVDVSTSALQATGGTILLGNATLGGSISGSAQVNSSGIATITSHNTYTGGTTLNGGELHLATADALGTGDVQLLGGSLYNDSGSASNVSVGTVRLNGADLIGDYTTEGSKGWELVADTTVQGSLTLGDGALTLLDGSVLTVSDTLLIDGATLVLSDDYRAGETYTLMMAGTISGDVSDIMLESVNTRLNYELSISGSSLLLNVTGSAASLTWGNVKKAVWSLNGGGWLEGGLYCDGDHVSFADGTVSIVGNVQPGEVLIAPSKSLTFKTTYNKKTGLYSGTISGDTALYISATTVKGKLTMNDGNTYTGGTFIEAGTVNAKGASSFGTGAITLTGGTLNLASKAVANDIVLTDSAIIKGGKKFLGSYTQEGGELMKGSVLNIAESATLSGGVVNGTLSGVGTVTIDGEVELGTTGKITTNELLVDDSLAVSTKGLAMNTKTSTITVTSGGQLISEGALKSANLTVDGGLLELHSTKASSVAITNNMSLSNGAEVTAFANVKAVNLTMTGAQLILGMPESNTWAFRPTGGASSSSSSVALSLSAKGNVVLTSSVLTLSGKISAGNLFITDSYVNMTSGKLQTIAVKNTLTLSGENNRFIVDFDATDGKSYKLFSFKYFMSDGSELYELFGWEDNGSYTLTANAKNITLTVLDADAWEAYMDELANSATVATLCEDDELVESAGSYVLERAVADVDPMLGKVADTLVQSTWGTVGASRAFGNTVAARGTHATALADGKGAAWISTMGGSSRISSDGGHAGADYTLTGAAFGMETRLSEKSTVGLAIGNSWGKVSTFSAFPVDQDSTHQGIYGKHLLGSSTTLSWMAAHTRTESDGNLAGMSCDWTQDALQLDARVDKLFAISDRTAVSAFVGMQYLATDKGECNGMSTGSLQNLRGEIGVSATHKATDKAYVYGELSFVGDMVRNNPTVTVGDYRSRGANPGRSGLNLSVGASYQLNDSWSLNGSYSLELMQNQTSHSANVGATYSF